MLIVTMLKIKTDVLKHKNTQAHVSLHQNNNIIIMFPMASRKLHWYVYERMRVEKTNKTTLTS